MSEVTSVSLDPAALDIPCAATAESPEAAAVYVLHRRPTAAEIDPAAFRQRRRRIELTLAWMTPVIFIGLWQIASSQGWLDARFFPPPSKVWTTGVSMVKSGVLWDNLYISLRRVLLGFLLGVVGGVIAGLCMGLSRTIRAALDPILTAFYMVPKLALLPLLLLIFGIGELPLILEIAITVFFFMWLSCMAAFIGVPESYREAGRAFGATRLQQFRHILVPAVLPDFFVALRLSIGVAVLVMVGIEFVQASSGIGWLIWQSWNLFLPAQMYVGIVTVAVAGVVLTMLIRLIGRLVVPWAAASQGSGRVPF
jgi:NitT/TauT family transport system permease protein/sulfonate transport system permease protein